jgi:nucleoside-diphosphate-sugar epimerase
MEILVTGTGQPLAEGFASSCSEGYSLRFPPRDQGVDWCDVETVNDLVAGVDAILHFAPPSVPDKGLEEGDLLDFATRSTYVLMQAGSEAGVGRIVLASTMAMFENYSPDYVIDEIWQPKPSAEAASLAPFLVEMTCREFARQGGIAVICLRFGDLDKAEGTTETDALAALDGALKMELDPLGYRWHVFHVYSGKRFPMRAARQKFGLGEIA